MHYQNVPMLARLLAEWGDRPAGALFLLPLWHPVLAAEHIGTLASIAAGRFIMQCTIGHREEQFAGMGVPFKNRTTLSEDHLAIVRSLLAGEGVTTPTLREARIAPIPSEPVEVWIGAQSPAAIDRAARLGDGWLTHPA